MNEYKLFIDNELLCPSIKADNIKEWHKKLIPKLPQLLIYPHYWNLVNYPKKMPSTIVEKIIYFSRPYRFYIKNRKKRKKLKHIETDNGYYFYGGMVENCMYELNNITTESSSDEDSTSDSSSSNSSASDSSASDSSASDSSTSDSFDDIEEINHKFIDFYIKKFTDIETLLKVINYPNPNENQAFSTLTLLINEKKIEKCCIII